MLAHILISAFHQMMYPKSDNGIGIGNLSFICSVLIALLAAHW